MKFIQNNFLDYYVSSAKQVIDYLKNTDPFHANIFVVGHSQGYQVVAKLAADFPTNITKAVCMSSNPFGQSYVENIQKIRQDELSGRISALSSQNQIDSIYKSFLQNMKGYQYYKVPELSENYSYYRTDYSFNCKLAIDDLVRIKCPVLVVYGSADITSINNDLLPFFFARSGKDNLTLHCYPGYTHNYYIKLGNGKYSERSNWQKVFIDIDMWLKSNQ